MKGVQPKQITVIDKAVELTLLPVTNELQPIPLTPEVLERCGFVKDYHGWIDHDSAMSFSLTKDNEILPCWHDRVLWPNAYKTLRHVHQLQNLYFALTGQELNIAL